MSNKVKITIGAIVAVIAALAAWGVPIPEWLTDMLQSAQ
jgi:hypothetical protein